MKCNPKRTLNMQRQREREERKKQEQEYLASLTDEEREQYLEEKRKRQEESLRLFSSLGKIANQLGVRKFY